MIRFFFKKLFFIYNQRICNMSNEDGRPQFFRHLELDEADIRFLYSFRELKQNMLRDGRDEYCNGKTYEK